MAEDSPVTVVELPLAIRRASPDFADELDELLAFADGLATVLLGGYTRFVERESLLLDATSPSDRERARGVVTRAVALIEELLERSDDEIRYAVGVEFVEALYYDDALSARLEPLLGPRTLRELRVARNGELIEAIRSRIRRIFRR